MVCRRIPDALLGCVIALAAAGLPSPAGAQTYDVEVNTTLNDLPVTVEPAPFSDRLVMKLTNKGATKVRCDLRYDASPQPIRRAYVYLEAGETAENSFQAKRNWFNVTVDVTCKPADK